MATTDETDVWYGPDGQVSQLRGLLFKASCLGATLLALGLVFVFLIYVAIDAFEPASVEPIWWVTIIPESLPGPSVSVPIAPWWLTFVATVLLPALALAGYYYRYDQGAGEVAYTSFGLPLVSALLAGGAVIFFRHIVTPHEWFALVVSAGVAYGLIRLHGRARQSGLIERGAVVTIVPLLALVGIPGFSVDRTIATPVFGRELFHVSFTVPDVVPSLRGLILSVPMLPMGSLVLLGLFVAPIGLAVGRYMRDVRESDRAGLIAGGGTFVIAAVGLGAAPVVGISALAWIVFTTVAIVPVGLYVERVFRNGDNVIGLAFPVVIAIGAALGVAVVEIAGFTGPNVWLDWSYLTEPANTTPRDAGIYPALVGSVMMILVVAVAAFPVGVGAAIYLEEYAPNEGLLGSFVGFIEVNISNLAGVPSVVYGLLGLALFVNTAGLRPGIVIVGGLTVGLLILPIVIVSAQEAIRSVPDSLRKASYGMGATRWQTVRNVVLPRALPGILTGTILALGRAIGETAPLLMVGVAAVVRLSPSSVFDIYSAMPRQLYTWAKLAQPEFYHGVLAAGVLTILIVLLMMNGTAIVLRNRYQHDD